MTTNPVKRIYKIVVNPPAGHAPVKIAASGRNVRLACQHVKEKFDEKYFSYKVLFILAVFLDYRKAFWMVCVLNLSLPISHTIPVKFRSPSLYLLFFKAAFLSHLGFSVTTKYGVKIHFQKFLLVFIFLFFQYDKEYARIQDLQEFLCIRTFPPAN